MGREGVSNRIAAATASLLVAITAGGCPMGAELENTERFPPFVGATGSGATTGTGGSAGATAGVAGAAGAAGYAPGCGGFSCDVNDALLKSCGRPGCHAATAPWAGLPLTTCADAALMVDRAAMHGDIDCAAPGEMFRACTPAELPFTCPTDVMLIDSRNVDNSWVLRKLDPAFVADSCGDPMPAPPGNSTAASVGWSEERRLCLMEFFRSLATAP